MGYTPMHVGETGVPFKQTVTDDSGAAVNLTGYNPATDFSLHMRNVNDPSIIKICNGPWTIMDATNGIVWYQWQASDVDTAGLWQMQFKAKNIPADQQTLEIKTTF